MQVLDTVPNRPTPENKSVAPTRIGINCLQVDPSFVGGVTTYALGLLEGFANIKSTCRFRLFVTPTNQSLFDNFRKLQNFDVSVVGDKFLPLRSSISRAASLANSSGMYKFINDLAFTDIQRTMESDTDLIYTPTVALRCLNTRKPTVLSMHDIQHVHHPEFFSWPKRTSRRIIYGLSARHAGYFQASSHYIKEDLMNHFTWLSQEQIEVIPSGVLIQNFAAPSGLDSIARRYDLPERFLLFPAQLWPHKNHLSVLKALKQIEAETGLRIPLVLTGAKFSAAPTIFKFIADQSMGYVRYLGKVPSRDIVALYASAAFMITATLHESSSLPILEAAAAGTPVIASRIPPLEELGQALQLNLFDPLDTKQLARLIVTLWKDESIGSAQAAHNREHISCFSWENTARKYVALFERIVSS